jgi:hypothetical protein
MSIAELDPMWVKSKVGTVIKYDSLKWLEYHMALGNLFQAGLVKTILYAPAIISGSMKAKDVNKETFDQFITTTSTVIELNMLQVKQYCYMPKK